jgi:non-ribosomal peptide synthetase component F
MLTETERHRIVEEWNDTDHAAYLTEQSLLDVLRQQVAATPDQIALEQAGQAPLSYAELDRISDLMAIEIS